MPNNCKEFYKEISSSAVAAHHDARGNIKEIKHDIGEFELYQSIFISKKYTARGISIDLRKDCCRNILLLSGEILVVMVDFLVEAREVTKITLNDSDCNGISVPYGIGVGYITLSTESLVIETSNSKFDKNYRVALNWGDEVISQALPVAAIEFPFGEPISQIPPNRKSFSYDEVIQILRK